jgi:predicted HNH restriction endonuclease
VIFQKVYDISNLPENVELESDLMKMLKVYEQYVTEENFDTEETDFSQALGPVYENKKVLKTHYARERNQTIVKKAKEAKLRAEGKLNCEICGFSFNEKYGEHGKDYIEAHHKVPLGEAQGIRETKIEDLALVCSNCHRMIHKKFPSYTIDEIKAIIR